MLEEIKMCNSTDADTRVYYDDHVELLTYKVLGIIFAWIMSSPFLRVHVSGLTF